MLPLTVQCILNIYSELSKDPNLDILPSLLLSLGPFLDPLEQSTDTESLKKANADTLIDYLSGVSIGYNWALALVNDLRGLSLLADNNYYLTNKISENTLNQIIQTGQDQGE